MKAIFHFPFFIFHFPLLIAVIESQTGEWFLQNNEK